MIKHPLPKEPAFLWNCFYEITQIPRPSKQEEKIKEYLLNKAKQNSWECHKDNAGNVIMKIPGTKGLDGASPIILQSHMDMVCEKTPSKNFDFLNDPIEVQISNGWITANNTTLGADNGIGMALSLALAEDPSVKHPPLELLFTVDEETGLHGALNLDASLLKGKKLINLDSEEWGSIYIGCAGGMDYQISRQIQSQPSALTHPVTLRLSVEHLKGGHSGLDIHLGRMNAIKVLANLLFELRNKKIELVTFSGGTAHNAIAREAFVEINISQNEMPWLKEWLHSKNHLYQKLVRTEDQNITLSIEEITRSNKVFSNDFFQLFLSTLKLFPHGAERINWNLAEPLTSTSNNLARVYLTQDNLFIETSLRFLNKEDICSLEQSIQLIGENLEAQTVKTSEYPGWNPNTQSQLLNVASETYQKLFHSKPKIKAIHAGLECGILTEKLGGAIEAISIGPNLKDVHSPSEQLEIESTNKTWEYLKALLNSGLC